MHAISRGSAVRGVATLFLVLFGLILPALAMASDLGLTEPQCRGCHGPTMADRHHAMVVSRGYECFKCHSFAQNPQTLMQEVTVTRNCLNCHTGSLADRHHALVDRKLLDCLTCHQASWDEQQLAYVIGFRFSPPGAGVISGVVTDNGLAPLAGVTLTTNTGAYVATTAADGSFVIDPVTAATYKLTASRAGYVEQTVRLRVIAGETTSADLQLAAAPTPLMLIEQCGDGLDNDGDGLADCADAACAGHASCPVASPLPNAAVNDTPPASTGTATTVAGASPDTTAPTAAPVTHVRQVAYSMPRGTVSSLQAIKARKRAARLAARAGANPK